MVTKKSKIDKIEDGVARIFAKADARIESGCDPIQADWQATLELYTFMMQKHLAVEIDLHLETIDGLKGVKMPYRNVKDPEYNRVFDGTAKQIYKLITGRSCPKLLKVM